MTVSLDDLDPKVGGWFGARSWDSEFCRRENHIEVPEGELCTACYFQFGSTATGFALLNEGSGWVYVHSDCFYEARAERDATGLVQERLDADYDAW